MTTKWKFASFFCLVTEDTKMHEGETFVHGRQAASCTITTITQFADSKRVLSNALVVCTSAPQNLETLLSPAGDEA